MKLTIETELETETGRWIAEVMELPGVMVYGETRERAIRKVKALALWRFADELEHGESPADLDLIEFAAPVVTVPTGVRDGDGA